MMLNNQPTQYWWVNQNQTFLQEVRGGYLWSPKRKSGGQYNQYYEYMRAVIPGDAIFSFCDKKIKAIGIATSYAYSFPRPTEFAHMGKIWDTKAGWKVDVQFFSLHNEIIPAAHIKILRSLLPDIHSPLQENGRGKQGVYLTRLSMEFAEVLIGLIGQEAQNIILQQVVYATNVSTIIGEDRKGINEWEEAVQGQISADTSIAQTEKDALVKSRRGQGVYRQNLMRIENFCRITKVDNPIHLIGSHIKPWRESNNNERLDGENGLLLTPSIDHLFDRGFISFKDNGILLIAPVADKISLNRLGLETTSETNVGNFTSGQQGYLEYHRDCIFLSPGRAVRG